MNKAKFEKLQKIVADHRMDLRTNPKYQLPHKLPSISYWTLASTLLCNDLYNGSKLTKDDIIKDLVAFTERVVIRGKILPPVYRNYPNIYATTIKDIKRAYNERIAIYSPMNYDDEYVDGITSSVHVGYVYPIMEWGCIRDSYDPNIVRDQDFLGLVSWLYKKSWDVNNVLYSQEFVQDGLRFSLFEVMPNTNQYAISIDIPDSNTTLYLIPPGLWNLQKN